MPTELRRHFEIEKQGRELHVVNGSLYHRVTSCRGGGVGVRGMTIWNHLQLHFSPQKGHGNIFKVNLRYGVGVRAWKQDVHS